MTVIGLDALDVPANIQATVVAGDLRRLKPGGRTGVRPGVYLAELDEAFAKLREMERGE